MASKIMKEFRAFAVKGNVIDLAVGVIIGGAFDPANERGKALAEEGLRRSTAAVADRGLLKLIP